MRYSSLAQARHRLMAQIVKQEVEAYISAQLHKKIPKRPCAQCGKVFQPRQRWHFLHTEACRKEWYRGQFKPRD